MAKSFKTLREKMRPEVLARVEEKAEAILASMPLHELRAAREISQDKLAKMLNMKQPSVSKMEKRTDMYISSLRSAVAAMGGELEIVAKFPDGSVRINQFENLEAKCVKRVVKNKGSIASTTMESVPQTTVHIEEKLTKTRTLYPPPFFAVRPLNINAAREIPKWTPQHSFK